MTKYFAATCVVVALLLLASCNEKIADVPRANQTPKTFLWLFPAPDSGIGTGVSRQRLHWWGEDPDGVVRGFLLSFAVFPTRITSIPNPDPFRYIWVTSNDTLMAFPLDTLFRNYTVVLRSVDNTFRGRDSLGIVRLNPNPYWDKDDNGRFDPGVDELLPDLLPALDPVGAIQTFPVRNTPPTIALAVSPSDPTQTTKLPDTTFTVITVSFKGSDDDGDNTLASYRIALNDTSNASRWLVTPLRDTVLTLVVPRLRSDGATGAVDADVYGGSFLGRHFIGRVPGMLLDSPNKVFIQARDVAGEYSPPITLPSGTDRWFVRKPRARLLLINDYIVTAFDNPIPTYLTTLVAVPDTTFRTVDVLDIGRGLTTNDKSLGKPGVLVPAFVDPALISTFLLYDYVVWYTDKFPSLGVAQLSIFSYLQNGGKVLFSANFSNVTDPRGALRDIAPLDSIDTENLSPAPPPPSRGTPTIPANFKVIADSSEPTSIYPQLVFNSIPAIHSVFMRPLYRRSDARYIYHLQEDVVNNPPLYIGTPNVGVVDGQRRIVFMGVPLHVLNNTAPQYGGQGLTAFFTRVFAQQFSANQRVNRRKF